MNWSTLDAAERVGMSGRRTCFKSLFTYVSTWRRETVCKTLHLPDEPSVRQGATVVVAHSS